MITHFLKPQTSPLHHIIKPVQRSSTSQTRPMPQLENCQHWHPQHIWRLPSCLGKNDIRIFFQIVTGLICCHTGEDYDYCMTSTQAIGADIIGMAETNMALQQHQLHTSLAQQAQKHFGATKTSFGFPDTTTNPVPDKETFQSGRSLTMITGSLVPMSHGGHIMDPTGLGRWSGHTLRGKSNAFLSIFTAYRACSGSIGTLPIGSTFSQEYKQLQWSQQIVSPTPHT